MKNPFKKSSVIDTLTNVGIGGAANVAMDYAVSQIDYLAGLGATTINAAKIALGVLGGTMTNNKMIRAAVDGIAVVGVSSIVKDVLADTTKETAAGLPQGTVGRPRPGNRHFRRQVAGVDFMGK